MSHNPVQIIARGSRAAAEAAAADIDSDILLEGATYSLLEEDEDGSFMFEMAILAEDLPAD